MEYRRGEKCARAGCISKSRCTGDDEANWSQMMSYVSPQMLELLPSRLLAFWVSEHGADMG
eukprot:615097-Pelagomonas_calceolata.AAC.1